MNKKIDDNFVKDINELLEKNSMPLFGTPEFNDMCSNFFGGNIKDTTEYSTLEVGELIDCLTEIIPQGVKMKYLDKVVKYDFNPNAGGMNLDSWRGNYSELTLDYDINGNDITLGQLLEKLEASIKGKIFYGYKGGEYRMNIDTPVWADQAGRYTERMIIGVEYSDDCIMLKTMVLSD